MKYDILLKDLIGKVPSAFARDILGIEVKGKEATNLFYFPHCAI